MSQPGPEQTPVDQALELLVFAPLGFALEARSLLPRFVERGRSQIELARVVGKFALRKGREDAQAALMVRQEQALGLLELIGVGGPTDADGPVEGDRAEPTPIRPAPSRPSAPPRPPDPGIDPEELAIPGYDNLSASQVVPRLESLDEDELDLIRRYEHGHRGRKTILNKIAQLEH